MANIKLKQLNFVTHELTKNESSEVMGGDFWNTLTGLVGIGNGILTIRQGIKLLNTSSAKKNSSSTDMWTQIALQEAFGPDW